MGTRRGTEEEGKKITTEELIKALRNCTNQEKMRCEVCPYNQNYENVDCVDDLMRDVADRLDEMMASEMGDMDGLVAWMPLPEPPKEET